jgi:hypothetical protein
MNGSEKREIKVVVADKITHPLIVKHKENIHTF